MLATSKARKLWETLRPMLRMRSANQHRVGSLVRRASGSEVVQESGDWYYAG